MIISNPKIKHIIPIKKPNLPCSYPVFPNTKTLQENEIMSSASTVCQGLQSCLEPLLHEPRLLMHQLDSSKQDLSFPWPQKQPKIPLPNNSENEKISEINTNSHEKSTGNWDFIQSLTTNSYNIKQSTHEPEQIYVHPLVKRSSSSLSTKSLEMCTESLGSETGSASGASFYEISYNKRCPTKINLTNTGENSKKIKPSSSFPPPLTSISGSEGVRVKTHREGGRLVIKAFSFSSCSSYFQTERGNGRLRLSLLKDGYKEIDPENEEEEEEEEEVEEDEEENLEDEKCEDEGDLNGCFWVENVKEDGGKIGGGKWTSTTSRCNGDGSGNKRLPSLHYCVAIS